MESLPTGLQPLAEYRQFILRHHKVPVNVALEPCNPHDPQFWMSASDAVTTAGLLGPDYDIGFVFTREDPFFFVDIDKCLDERGSPSELATSLLDMFQGAFVEISQSRRGLHIIATGQPSEHSSKNGELGIELYTAARYVALTGWEYREGSVVTECQASLQYIINNYFPPKAVHVEHIEWSTEPVPEWSGPEDDEVLLAKMLQSGSVSGAFRGSATFADLWQANVTVLSQNYPDPQRAYDASAADAAMAQHLAFWTGKNCERIAQLMWKSGLKRDKWLREDYLPRTITYAVAQQTDVYNAKSFKEPPPPPPPNIEYTEGHQFLSPENQITHFKGCVYIRDLHRIWTPDGSFQKPEQFRAMYGGYIFGMDATNEKTTRSAWEAFTENQAVRFPRVTGVCFRPERPSGEIIKEEGRSLINTYVPIETRRIEGDPSPLLRHLELLFPDQRDRDILLAYMAALVQYPGVKFQWCPIVQGVEGNGKTILMEVLAHCVGHRYTHLPNASELGHGGSKFNSWIQNKLFIGIEDIFTSDRRELTEALKPLITNRRIEIQAKGVDQITTDNRANFFMCTNHKDAMRINFDTRRYAMMFSAQQTRHDKYKSGMMSDHYFPRLYNWLREEGYAICNNYLRGYNIPDELNPAIYLQEAPSTTSTKEAIELSRGNVEQEIMERIEENKPGFANGWVSSTALDNLLAELKMTQKIPRNRRRDLMRALEYDWHPGLEKSAGRVNMPIMMEQATKPKLFIHKDHPDRQLMEPTDILKSYLNAQGYPANG